MLLPRVLLSVSVDEAPRLMSPVSVSLDSVTLVLAGSVTGASSVAPAIVPPLPVKMRALAPIVPWLIVPP